MCSFSYILRDRSLATGKSYNTLSWTKKGKWDCPEGKKNDMHLTLTFWKAINILLSDNWENSLEGQETAQRDRDRACCRSWPGYSPLATLQFLPSLRPWKPLSWQLLLGSLCPPALGSWHLPFYAARNERRKKPWGGSHSERQKNLKYGGEGARKDDG